VEEKKLTQKDILIAAKAFGVSDNVCCFVTWVVLSYQYGNVFPIDSLIKSLEEEIKKTE